MRTKNNEEEKGREEKKAELKGTDGNWGEKKEKETEHKYGKAWKM